MLVVLDSKNVRSAATKITIIGSDIGKGNILEGCLKKDYLVSRFRNLISIKRTVNLTKEIRLGVCAEAQLITKTRFHNSNMMKVSVNSKLRISNGQSQTVKTPKDLNYKNSKKCPPFYRSNLKSIQNISHPKVKRRKYLTLKLIHSKLLQCLRT